MEDKRLKFQKGKQRELFVFLLKENNLTQGRLAKVLGFSRRTISDYFLERSNIKLSTFQKLASISPKVEEFRKFVEEELPLNWGVKKGGLVCATKAGIKPKMERVRSFIVKNSEKSRMENKQDFFHPIIEEMIEENVDLKAILAVCLLTDGALTIEEGTYRICFYSKDEVLRDFSKALISKLSKFKLNVCLGSKETWMIRVSDKNLAKEMLQLSPDFRTFPPEGCLQPTISFLKNANYSTKKWALRTAFSTDGCISLPKQGRPELNLACYNKSNSEEWKELLAEFCIKGKLSLRAGDLCKGVRTYDSKSIYNFYKLGGFLDCVKISTKSKNYCGMTKNELLSQIVHDFSKRRIRWG